MGYRGPIPKPSDACNIPRCQEEIADIERLCAAGIPITRAVSGALGLVAGVSVNTARDGPQRKKARGDCGRAGEEVGQNLTWRSCKRGRPLRSSRTRS